MTQNGLTLVKDRPSTPSGAEPSRSKRTLSQDLMEQAARRTFKITKLFNVHWRVLWSMRVRGLSAGHTGDDRLLLLNR